VLKLWEFEKLCRTESDNGNGDVRALWLSEENLKELQADITKYALSGGGKSLPVHVHDIPALREGGYPMYAVNPATRAECHLHICVGDETADVFFPGGGFEAHICSRCKLGFCSICTSRTCQCSHKGR
jgi:hypothetical protein